MSRTAAAVLAAGAGLAAWAIWRDRRAGAAGAARPGAPADGVAAWQARRERALAWEPPEAQSAPLPQGYAPASGEQVMGIVSGLSRLIDGLGGLWPGRPGAEARSPGGTASARPEAGARARSGAGFGLPARFGETAPAAPAAPGPAGQGALAPLLTLIGSVEAPDGYDQVYGGSVIRPPAPLTSMTVAEVLEWQDRSVRAGSPSSAAGRYQIIRGTLRSLVREGAVGLDERFTPEVQDRAARALLRRRGLDRWRAGALSDAEFGQNLSMEFASLPVFTRDREGRPARGQSYYAGDGLNKSLVDQTTVLGALRQARG